MEQDFLLKVTAGHELHNVSDMLFGIFLEDINFSCDGGLNANLVNNASFDGVYLSRKGYGMMRSVILKPDPRAVVDRLRYWIPTGVKLESCHDSPVAENSWYARVAVDGPGRLENLGYNGAKKHLKACGMSIQTGQEYAFSCWTRGSYQGSLTVSIADEGGAALNGKGAAHPAEPVAGMYSDPLWQQNRIRQTGHPV